jgi:hypothetical protein
MAEMKHSLKAVAAVAGAGLAVPAIAWAAVDDVGTAGGDVAPSCPSKPCLAISKTTGFQAKVGDARAIDIIPKDGRIVAWTITLSKPGKKQTAYFNTKLGGEPEAQITILRPGNKLHYRVIAQGEPQKLTPYLGQKVQFPLVKSIPVKKGYVVALTVPTWAPALAVNQPGTSSWRAARAKGACSDFDKQTAQSTNDAIAQWYCLYRTARLTYSATLISTP